MNLAKISANGQITVPGEIVIHNASSQAIIYNAQNAFAGVAEHLGVHNEEDVQELVNEVRYGKDD
jgi:antitoxin PrlF